MKQRYVSVIFNSWSFLLLMNCFFCMGTNSTALCLTIMENHQSNYSIIIGNSASPSEKYAAEELQMFLGQISGCKIPVVQTDGGVSGPMIFVGDNSALRSLCPEMDFSKYGPDEFTIKTSDPHLILAGSRIRGSLYAVYAFLEDILGCRWYTTTVSKIPKMATIVVNDITIHEKPALECRESFWWEAFDGDWSARNRANGPEHRLTEKHGGKITYRGVHTFFRHVPPLKWFKDHPEYYTLESGRRLYENAELCLTNPEVAKVYTHSLRTLIDSDPEGTIFSVSQEDWYGPCVCPHCAELDKKEGDTYAASLIFFVNRVAERIEKSHPDKYVDTLPYKYTSKAPKTLKPGKNVVIRFVHTYTPETCDSHAITDCEKNENFIRDYKDWAALTNRLYLWDYYVDFSHYLLPYPNFNAIKADIKWLVRNGLKGIRCQGAYSNGGGGELGELRAYLIAKLLWNPERDADYVINDFLNGVYGPAGWHIRRYIDLLEDKVARERIHTEHHSPPSIEYLTPEIISEADRLFDEAERTTAQQPDVLDRVKKARLSLRYAKLARPVARQIEGDKVIPISTPDAPRYGTMEELKNFMADARRFGIQFIREGEALDITGRRLALNNMDEYRLVTVENPLLRVDLLPQMGGRIYRIIHKKSGRNLLRIPTTHEWPSPMSGGYSETVYRGGSEEEYDCIVKKVPGGQRIVLTSAIDQHRVMAGVKVEREIFLPDNATELLIKTTATMLKELNYPTRISASIDISLGDFEEMQFGFLKDGKYFYTQPPPEPGPRGNRTKSYVYLDIKGEGWGAINKKEGIAFIDNFDPKAIDGCTISFRPGIKSLTLGIDGLGKESGAGESVILQHTLKIIDTIDNIVVQ